MTKEIDDLLYRRLKSVQREFGLARFELGTLLEVFKSNESLWRGRATSFSAFLEEERIQFNGAAQFMRVAKKFVLELKLEDHELAELACVNFRILDIAARLITPENKDEVLAIVTALGERDARAALGELTKGDDKPIARSDVPPEVRTLMRKYREMPDDYRIAFMAEVKGTNRTARHTHK